MVDISNNITLTTIRLINHYVSIQQGFMALAFNKMGNNHRGDSRPKSPNLLFSFPFSFLFLGGVGNFCFGWRAVGLGSLGVFNISSNNAT